VRRVQVTPFPNPFSGDDGDFLYMCHEDWPKPTARQFFTVTSLILQYVVPVGLITYCYTCVSVALHRRVRRRDWSQPRRTASFHGRRSTVERALGPASPAERLPLTANRSALLDVIINNSIIGS